MWGSTECSLWPCEQGILDPGHAKWGGWASSEDTSLVPLETGTGKPCKKKKREEETKAVWSPEEPDQEELVMVIATSSTGARPVFKIQGEVF